ncbi:sugar-transfer associated ATP-grasp domain-containing protein [Salicibibacter kimchii]|uniref:sugar-transfer associated ATP-grasp domain-containing protein n=1 Tax=Salicibibacter kimchii TaxID=2099786 RepID=UPI0013570463|nr:sugar-transfer associated ATP-grasp domain-containing protein [Salicibibacter kimchii]
MTNKKAMPKDLTVYQDLGIKTDSHPFKSCLNAGLLNDVDEFFVKEVQEYWKRNYGKSVDPVLNIAFMNLTGIKDNRITPRQVLRKKILPLFNDYDMSIGYKDKNLYDVMINPTRSPKTVLKNINGNYFDTNNNSVDTASANKLLLEHNSDLIIKPSRTNNGKRIVKLKVEDENIYLDGEDVTIHHLEEMYAKNFIVQEAIEQHSSMAVPHPSSVNTLRLYTFRWKQGIKYLPSFARFGGNNHINDNTGTGGLCLGITDTGKFLNVAVDDDMRTYTHHPTTGYCFADLNPIPNFDEVKQFVKDCHKNILHLDVISWDIAISSDGKPIFIEANFSGPLWLGQFITQQPPFGDFTEEVLQHVSDKLKTIQPKLMKKDRLKKQKKEMKETRGQVDELKAQNKELKEMLKKKDKEL